MTVTSIHVMVAIFGLGLVVKWNLLMNAPQTAVAIMWVFLAGVVKFASWHALTLFKWLCGAAGSDFQRVNDAEDSRPFSTSALLVSFNPILLTYAVGVSETFEWFNSHIVNLIVSTWIVALEQQLEKWPSRRDTKFRVVSGALCCFSLLCGMLHWAFHATVAEDRSPGGSVAQYVVTVSSASAVIRIWELLIYGLAHVWHSMKAPHDCVEASNFDPMDEAGLWVRSACAFAALFVSIAYCPKSTGFLVQFTVIRSFCHASYSVLLLLRLRCILNSVAEVEATALCVICQDPIAPPERGRRLQCGHIFHSLCLRRWLMRRSCCPTCRQPPFKRGEGPDSCLEVFSEIITDTRSPSVQREERGPVRQRRLALQDVGVQAIFTDPEQSTMPTGPLFPLRQPYCHAVGAASGFVAAYDGEGSSASTVLPISNAQLGSSATVESPMQLDVFADMPIETAPTIARRPRKEGTARVHASSETSASIGPPTEILTESTATNVGRGEGTRLWGVKKPTKPSKRQRGAD
uniref:Uncharacterized protein TCIL3000_10_6370 n=1 Tax=Trypanosoma congolense (strain IL3000) TaxID=1068625 RepID=G0UWU7_TRYCI|nr:unnamed protein product [Trypanosoma congolense IL3000]